MPVPLPNLDDRTYPELTAEARALIPGLLPDWTNHNPSDPGVVLVELLAWLTEMLLFQVNEIPPASTEAFLKLLNGTSWTRPEATSLDDAILLTMRQVRERYRAVTPDDYEHLALHLWPDSDEAAGLGGPELAGLVGPAGPAGVGGPAGLAGVGGVGVLAGDAGLGGLIGGGWNPGVRLPGGTVRLARVRCVPRRNLAATDAAARAEPAPAHVSLVVVPEPGPGEEHPEPSPDLLAALTSFFAPRHTLTTRFHVVGPRYVEVGIAASLALHEDAPPGEALDGARRALAALFDPLTGGPDGGGWTFGRNVFVSEVYAVLEQVRLVNYVDAVQVTGPRPLVAADGSTTGVELDAHKPVQLTTLDLTAYDIYGQRYATGAGVP
jgi:hypothetical protein